MEKIIPRIDMDEIGKVVDDTEGLPENRKRFIFDGIRMRYENILLEALGFK